MASQSAGGSRFYRYRAPGRGATQSNDVERGMQIGQQVGGLLQSVAGAIKGAKADAVANQLMNAPATAQANAQALADPDPDPNPDGTDNLSPTAATDPSGTQNPTPFTGGVAEMKQRQDFQNQQLESAVKQAQLQNYLAEAQGTGRYAKRAQLAPRGVSVGSGSASRWTQNAGDGTNPPTGRGGSSSRGQGKPAPYQPNSIDATNDDSADSMSHVAADFDDAFGNQKGLYAKFLANVPSLAPDANGNVSLPGKDPNGPPLATITKEDVPYWLQRTNAARRATGLKPISSALSGYTGSNPASTNPPGSQDNPVVLTNSLQARSLPYGSYVKDPNTGQVSVVNKPQATQ